MKIMTFVVVAVVMSLMTMSTGELIMILYFIWL